MSHAIMMAVTPPGSAVFTKPAGLLCRSEATVAASPANTALNSSTVMSRLVVGRFVVVLLTGSQAIFGSCLS